MRQVSVVFAVSKSNKIACTTRPTSKARFVGDFSLPGGKQDPGESIIDTARRECIEEGWSIEVPDAPPFFTAIMGEPNDKFQVNWFLGKSPVALTEYKDKARGISPIEKSIEEVYHSGRYNDKAVAAYLKMVGQTLGKVI